MGIIGILVIALLCLVVGFVAGLLAQRPLRLANLEESLRELYPLAENPAWNDNNYDLEGKLVVEGITLPNRRMYRQSPDGHEMFRSRMFYDKVRGWQPVEPGYDYTEPRYRIV